MLPLSCKIPRHIQLGNHSLNLVHMQNPRKSCKRIESRSGKRRKLRQASWWPPEYHRRLYLLVDGGLRSPLYMLGGGLPAVCSSVLRHDTGPRHLLHVLAGDNVPTACSSAEAFQRSTSASSSRSAPAAPRATYEHLLLTLVGGDLAEPSLRRRGTRSPRARVRRPGGALPCAGEGRVHLALIGGDLAEASLRWRGTPPSRARRRCVAGARPAPARDASWRHG